MSPNFYKDKGEINGSQAVSSLFLINKNKFYSGEAHIVSQLSIPAKMNAGAKLYTLQFSSQTSGVNLTFNNASFNYLKNLNKNYPDLKIGLESASHTNDKAISDLPEGTDISNMNYTGLTFMTDDGKLPSELKLDIPVSIDLKGANLQLESAQLGDFNNLLQNSTTNQDFFRSMTNASLITTGVYHFQANNDDQDNGWAYNKSFFMLYNPSDLTVNKSLTIKEGQNIDPIKDFNVNPSDGITYVIKDSNGNVVFDSTKDSPDKLKDLKAADKPYTITFSKFGYNDATAELTVTKPETSNPGNSGNNNSGSGSVTNPTQPSTPSQPSQPSIPSQPQQPSQPTLPSPSMTGDDSTGLPNWAAVKGQSIYGIKGLYLYKHANFNKNQRVKYYAKTSRVNRPQFIVKGYKSDDNGNLRYKVQQYNPSNGKYVAGTKGYITANEKYVVRAYYTTTPKNKKIKVLSKNGVKSYKNIELTGKAKLYKKGSTLKVKSIKKYKLATRYQLTNGNYVTGSKKFIIWK